MEGLLTQHFEHLDIRQPQRTRAQALLAVVKQVDTKQEQVDAAFSSWATKTIAVQTTTKLTTAFSAATALFPVIPATCTRLFLTDGFVPGLVPLLQTSRVAEDDAKDDGLQTAILELLSAACLNKACRESIQQYCQPSINHLRREERLQALATLVSIKISGGNVDSTTVDSLIRNVQTEAAPLTIECLAYASLTPSVKEQIVNDATVVKSLVGSLNQESILSTLTIFVHVTAYRQARSEEQKKMAQLKAYANSSKTAPEDPLDNDGMVKNRCSKVVDAGLVSALSSLKELSNTSLHMIAQILHALAREPKHRTKMVQSGAIKLLLHVQEQLKRQGRQQRTAAHALSRILISVNPEHVFSSAVSATTAVSTIIPLLTPDQEAEERDLLPTFEALLALTNLASMSDAAVTELILRSSWTILEDQLLLSSNILVQRTSTELVCNLMLAPTGVAKFADGSTDAARRLHILLALADVEDLATRRAAGGALAMLTEWDTSVKAILQIARGMKIILSMCADGQEDVRHRGIICALNCTSMPGTTGIEAVEKLKKEGAHKIVQTANTATKSPDVQAAAAELLSRLG